MQLGICADTATLASLPPSLSTEYYLEVFLQEFLQPEVADANFVSPAGPWLKRGFKIPASNRILPAEIKVVGPDVDYARLDQYAATTFRRAKQIGMTLVVFGSAGARMIPPGFSATKAFEQYVDILRQLGPLAEEQGVTLLVEPLNRGECNLVNTLLEGAEAVRRANTNGVKLLVDIFHMLRNGESPDDILKVGPLLKHAHVAENKDRAAPGVNGDNFRSFFRALRRVNYDARLTIEATWNDLARETKPALAELKKQLADSGY